MKESALKRHLSFIIGCLVICIAVITTAFGISATQRARANDAPVEIPDIMEPAAEEVVDYTAETSAMPEIIPVETTEPEPEYTEPAPEYTEPVPDAEEPVVEPEGGPVIESESTDEQAIEPEGEQEQATEPEPELEPEPAIGSDEPELSADDEELIYQTDKDAAIDALATAEAYDVTYRASSDGVSVDVVASSTALPEDATLSVTVYDENSPEYAEAAEAINFDTASGRGMIALDISFMADGEEVEPTEAVEVTIDVSNILPADADVSTLEVKHLVESDNGVVAYAVADESTATEGTINEAAVIATFSVTSFSKFTVEWDPTNPADDSSIEVHVYNLNGTGIEELIDDYQVSIANYIDIEELVSHLHGSSDYVSSYHYEYATVFYEVTNPTGAGWDAYTVGGSDNSVVSISKNGTVYTVTLADGTTETIDNAYSIVIHLYYSLPTVTIDVSSGEHSTAVELETTNEYFKGLDAADSEVTYAWTLSDEDLGTITNNEDGIASFVWNTDNAEEGDQVTVYVTMTNTYTDEDGTAVTEIASDSYTLTYGERGVTITVYANDGSTQANAHVALVDEDGNTVATGTTGSDGTVELWAPDGTYTVGVTYVVATDTSAIGSTTRYTAEGTVTVEGEHADTSVTLDSGISSSSINGSSASTSASTWDGTTPYYYEHIDVKIAVAGEAGATEQFSDLDSVYVFDKYGNLIYMSDDLIVNENTTDYNVRFDINGAEDVHSIVVSSEDIIVITYEVIVTYDDGTTETKTYTATISSELKYADDEYYEYTNINAFRLYNALYGTSYASQEEFEAAWGPSLAGYTEYGISLDGLYYTQAADYLCDTGKSFQAGLDFVIDVTTIETIVTGIDFRVAKEYVDVPSDMTADELGQFEFSVIELSDQDVSSTDTIWDASDDKVVSTSTGTTGEWTLEDGVWVSMVTFEGDTDWTYESESGTN